jgi:hypothetical protein
MAEPYRMGSRFLAHYVNTNGVEEAGSRVIPRIRLWRRSHQL